LYTVIIFIYYSANFGRISAKAAQLNFGQNLPNYTPKTGRFLADLGEIRPF
jgi:hypothetical protein